MTVRKGDLQMEILKVRQIHKIYGEKENKVHALKDVSFTVRQGEFIAIVGTSGSGKSTLLNLIGGLDTPTQGQIIIRGHDIAALNNRYTYRELTVFSAEEHRVCIPELQSDAGSERV